MHLRDWYVCLCEREDALFVKKIRKVIAVEIFCLTVLSLALWKREADVEMQQEAVLTATTTAGEDYIKWVDFNVSYEALCAAYDWDMKTHGTKTEINWIASLRRGMKSGLMFIP